MTDDRLYTARFVQVFAAVLLFMTAVALQFHFGQYVEYLGHGVDVLGRILSISMVGTLLIRLQVGRWIDRAGCKPTWLVGAAVFTVATGSIQLTSQLWLIVLLRTLSAMAMAAVMTTAAVIAAQLAPPARRAESIGSMGLAGLLGIMVGPTLGDVIFAGPSDSITPYRVFFSASAACSLLSGVVMFLLTLPKASGLRGADDVQAGGRRTQLAVIAAHWPGVILLVGLVFAMVFCVQSLYLERLAEARGFRDIKLFYLVYCPTAIALRVVFRRLPQQIGRTRTLLVGMVLFAGGLLCLMGVVNQWGLILPGVLMGAGHCFIFPSMVDLAAERFPAEHRGTGTSLILGAGDLGMLIGFAALGEVIGAFGFDAALASLAAAVLLAASYCALCRREAVFSRKARV